MKKTGTETEIVMAKKSEEKKPSSSSSSFRDIPTLPMTSSYRDIPTTDRQRKEAQETVESKQSIPHVYLTFDCQLPAWLREKGSDLQALLLR